MHGRVGRDPRQVSRQVREHDLAALIPLRDPHLDHDLAVRFASIGSKGTVIACRGSAALAAASCSLPISSRCLTSAARAWAANRLTCCSRLRRSSSLSRRRSISQSDRVSLLSLRVYSPTLRHLLIARTKILCALSRLVAISRGSELSILSM